MSTPVRARGGRRNGIVERVRTTSLGVLLQVALTVAVVPWLVQPGVVQPDTKVDLVVDPGRYLARAFSAWSTHSGFGELQNQAYGYLFPVGPVFLLGQAAGLPGWATQRVWWSLLLGVAFLGAAGVARRVLGLGVGTAALVGVVYAFSPRVLTLLSELSVEAWPGALLPWFVLAAHAYLRGRWTTRRFVGVVGVLAASCGGVNATASLVPILGAGLYLALVGRRVRPLGAYGLGAALGAAWWLGPLLVLGRYAYPFLDYIETARITTAVTSVPGVLRGASDWVAYIIDASGHPVWQSGWVVAQSAMSIVGGLALSGAGLWGMARARRTQEGAPRELGALSVMLVLGVLGMGVAYVGAVSGPFASLARDLLDGPLAAARNVHKLDPLVRLPLVLGVGLLVERCGRRRLLVAGGVALAAAGSVAPFWQGRLGDASGVRSVPASLTRTAALIDAAARRDGGSTLVLPSARTASFTWGTSTDEPLTAAAASPIAWRASAPLVHPGAQRLMDAVDAAVAAGRDLDAVADALSRAGVHRVVVRHGLTAAEQAPPADLVVTHLAGDPHRFPHHRIVGQGQSRYDLFDVTGPGPLGTAVSVGVLGGPESTISLAAAGVRPDVATVTGRAGGWVTDDVRKRVYANGRPVALAFGPTLAAGDASDARLGARDLDYPGRSASLTTLATVGADAVTATASAADPFDRSYLGPGAGAASALDGDPTTAWLAPTGSGGALDLTWTAGAARDLHVRLTPATTAGARIAAWTIVIDGHAHRVAPGAQVPIDIPRGARHLHLRPEVVGPPDGAAGIAELTDDDGVLAAAPLLPGVVDPRSTGVVLTRTTPTALGAALRSEDGVRWQRLLRVTRGGLVDVRFLPRSGSCSGVRLDVRAPDGRIAASRGSGCERTLDLPAGTDLVRLAGTPVDHVVLTPRAASALTALGRGSTPPHTPVLTALTTGANAGWHAPTGQGLVVDGWQQAFVGRVAPAAVWFAPQTWHVTALVGGACGALLAVALALWPTRRAGEAMLAPDRGCAADTARSSRGAAVAGAAVVAVMLAGWWAIPVLVFACAVPGRRRPLVSGVALAMAGPVMATLGVVDHASIGAFAGQLLALSALTSFMLADVGGPDGWRVVRRTATTTGRARD